MKKLTEDDKVGKNATTNHQWESGKGKQQLVPIASGQWLAMGIQTGRWVATKALTLAMS